MTLSTSKIVAPPRPEKKRDQLFDREIRVLRARDNGTNFVYLAQIYAILAVTIAGTIWLDAYLSTAGLSLWWSAPVTVLAIVVIGASQHQLGGAVHEATHYMLFRNRQQNELVSDWLCAFPLYTTTYQFRLHHLAHHQFVNDPDRDPDISQLRDSGHWLDFPIDHITFVGTLIKQLWLPNLIRYTITRARYSALGVDTNPYHDPDIRSSKWPIRIGVLYAVAAPILQIYVTSLGNAWLLGATTLILWGAVIAYYSVVPEASFPSARIQPVVSHRKTAINRISFLALIYGALTWMEFRTGAPAWFYFALLWIVPLFTTFPLFMILRQWVQHGNGDRGRLTNTRVFLVNPLARYAVFPWGMDYHLPHHLFASVPHYKLKTLHELLLRNEPEYAREGIVVEGYFQSPDGQTGNPTVLDVLGPAYAAADGAHEAYIDNHALDDAEITGSEHIAREAELSARSGRG